METLSLSTVLEKDAFSEHLDIHLPTSRRVDQFVGCNGDGVNNRGLDNGHLFLLFMFLMIVGGTHHLCEIF